MQMQQKKHVTANATSRFKNQASYNLMENKKMSSCKNYQGRSKAIVE